MSSTDCDCNCFLDSKKTNRSKMMLFRACGCEPPMKGSCLRDRIWAGTTGTEDELVVIADDDDDVPDMMAEFKRQKRRAAAEGESTPGAEDKVEQPTSSGGYKSPQEQAREERIKSRFDRRVVSFGPGMLSPDDFLKENNPDLMMSRGASALEEIQEAEVEVDGADEQEDAGRSTLRMSAGGGAATGGGATSSTAGKTAGSGSAKATTTTSGAVSTATTTASTPSAASMKTKVSAGAGAVPASAAKLMNFGVNRSRHQFSFSKSSKVMKVTHVGGIAGKMEFELQMDGEPRELKGPMGKALTRAYWDAEDASSVIEIQPEKGKRDIVRRRITDPNTLEMTWTVRKKGKPDIVCTRIWKKQTNAEILESAADAHAQPPPK
eukprot:g4914.t1